ncbi:similar to Saccharomyces cerevisiae YLR118C Acyl-protein thioesterase responsible for depalmitoylation of Gpa1p [Maudiozyma barnettii]|uniref:Acyl-protein thioesterase 1 n=1 Tax=Maudiozyma barnettii TaxID=61262 RepID=A0A8H2VHC8_9SACH|nr:palmitoyl-(protein) hydrolase [Kazachstania barnettii]CAB4255456.1 similar to Saccharomyces cerevisiae YLR118C Acyl-protein thioesterase responsible for depalmitoylation of Gpa1p [Kazachstania barnettii]CAD1783915.1 similar to Saccharomyces cerevisiae YLR118C Acyl-protein thioesterase responsible for depalmitoylation of Gpa1p [Kazachstania barnettii]
MNQAVRIASRTKPHTHVLIVLHGLGDTGQGWTFLASELQQEKCFDSTSFIFPNAPHIPITANSGMHMPGWFDIKEWDPHMKQFDTEGYLKSLQCVEDYVEEQMKNGIPAKNIIIGGFSQGAALTLGSTLNLKEKIGGFFALSGFINSGIKDVIWDNEVNKSAKSCNLDTPIFHGHGDWDPIVAIEKGKQAERYLTEECHFKDYNFHEYAHLEHSVAPQELRDLTNFIKKCWQM